MWAQFSSDLRCSHFYMKTLCECADCWEEQTLVPRNPITCTKELSAVSPRLLFSHRRPGFNDRPARWRKKRRRSTRTNFGRRPERLGYPVSVPIHTFTEDTLSEEIEKIEEEIAELSAGILDISTKQQASSSLALTTDRGKLHQIERTRGSDFPRAVLACAQQDMWGVPGALPREKFSILCGRNPNFLKLGIKFLHKESVKSFQLASKLMNLRPRTQKNLR